jgi:hypothetical protein
MTDSNTEPGGGIRLRTRTIGVIHADDDTVIVVEHVYEPEGAALCEDCGKPAHDPGMVGLTVSQDDDEPVSTLLSAAEALVLAERLTRAASLVLESQEAEGPDNA